ncbi:hypothetical protein CRG98_050244, partial [Punica granatum]
MPPRRRDRVEDVHDRENLRHLEQRMDQRDQRMDRMMEQLTQQMAALMENQNRRNPNLNSDLIERKSRGDGEPEFNEEEIVTVETERYRHTLESCSL